MYQQLRAPERLFRIGQWCVAVLFAYFLTQVGASLIADVPSVSRAPAVEDFQDKAALGNLEQQRAPLLQREQSLQESARTQSDQLQKARDQYQHEKESFDNWKEARRSTGQSEQNPEVVLRARNLDQLLKQQKTVEAAVASVEDAHRKNAEQLEALNQQINTLNQAGYDRFLEANRIYSLKAFGFRLALVGPVLALAIWLFRRYRKSDQWPFIWGFGFFALFAFFFELVPYLPSFGDYIRYGVGAVLTFWGGRALIAALKAYLERKQQEQAAPQEARKHEIRYEKALESMAKSHCPGCERKVVQTEGGNVNFCMHCGLKLFRQCGHCGLRHNAFFPFCPSCGTAAKEDTQTDAQPADAPLSPAVSTPPVAG